MKQTLPFPIGTRVRTPFVRGEEHVVRRITSFDKWSDKSDWKATADGGDPCPHCHRSATPIPLISVEWFKLVKP